MIPTGVTTPDQRIVMKLALSPLLCTGGIGWYKEEGRGLAEKEELIKGNIKSGVEMEEDR